MKTAKYLVIEKHRFSQSGHFLITLLDRDKND